MPYTKSIHRKGFSDRLAILLSSCKEAQRCKVLSHDLRDMIFQCAIFQASAAMETYLKLSIESWFQSLVSGHTSEKMPEHSRAFIVSQSLSPLFSKFIISNDEKELSRKISSNKGILSILSDGSNIPHYISGKTIHNKIAYPSEANLNKLFSRVGIDKFTDKVSAKLSRDASLLIDGFQSVRTAAAHSSPIPLTIVDVKRLLHDCESLVAVMDRILYGHIVKHGGLTCWKIS